MEGHKLQTKELVTVSHAGVIGRFFVYCDIHAN